MYTDALAVLLAVAAACVLSFGACLLIVRSFAWHTRFTADVSGLGTQNRHGAAVPRVGGAAVVTGALAGWWAAPPGEAAALLGAVLAVCLPALAAGLLEDTTRRVGALWRLAATGSTAALAWHVLGARIAPVGWPAVDALLAVGALCFVLTALAVAGMANAVNIIDGTNGLASGCLLIMLGAVGLVAWHSGDVPLATAAGVLGGAVAGFFGSNCPHGRVFLGDGGAYFGGSAVAVLALLLVLRNPEVSPLFLFALTAYPVIETGYSTLRRLRARRSPFVADRLHLHSLIQVRLLRCAEIGCAQRRRLARNARTAPYLWAVCLCGAWPCVVFASSSPALGAAIGLTATVYALLYRTVVRGRAPAWLRQERGGGRERSALGLPSVLG